MIDMSTLVKPPPVNPNPKAKKRRRKRKAVAPAIALTTFQIAQNKMYTALNNAGLVEGRYISESKSSLDNDVYTLISYGDETLGTVDSDGEVVIAPDLEPPAAPESYLDITPPR